MAVVESKTLPFEVDDQDLELVLCYSWWISHYGYPTCYHEGGCVQIYVLLLGKAPEGTEWDHRDKNPLNNRRNNLRAITHRANIRNSKTYANNTSGVRGVRRFYGSKGWQAYIGAKHLGYFATIEEATAARKSAEELYWGDER